MISILIILWFRFIIIYICHAIYFNSWSIIINPVHIWVLVEVWCNRLCPVRHQHTQYYFYLPRFFNPVWVLLASTFFPLFDWLCSSTLCSRPTFPWCCDGPLGQLWPQSTTVFSHPCVLYSWERVWVEGAENRPHWHLVCMGLLPPSPKKQSWTLKTFLSEPFSCWTSTIVAPSLQIRFCFKRALQKKKKSNYLFHF